MWVSKGLLIGRNGRGIRGEGEELSGARQKVRTVSEIFR